jgi:DNA-binding LacI/PurR family transcriptional regulator
MEVAVGTMGPGRGRPRLEDVAAAVGLSAASVSLVLRGAPGPSALTRERVLEAAAQLGYRPDRTASRLASRRSRLLGVMMDVRNAYHADLVEDLDEAAERHGYDVVLTTVTRGRDERRAIETLIDSRCEALVLLGPEAPDAELATLGRQVHVVAVGRPLQVPGIDVVRAGDDDGVGAAVDHLVGLGHREIAYVDGGGGTIAVARRHGYQRAMRRHALAGRSRVIPGDHTEEAGSRAGQLLTGPEGRPTAVVAFNDRVAVGLLDALARAGLAVPGDVSVVGYDDGPLARLAHVGLTTVNQNSRELTEQAVTAVVERLEGGRTESREVVLPPRLVVRTTTAPPAR